MWARVRPINALFCCKIERRHSRLRLRLPRTSVKVGRSHCTVRMTVVVRETEPPVAVTVMVDVPAGVPPLGVVVWAAHP